MAHRPSLNPIVYVALGFTGLMVLLATGDWALLIPIAAAVVGFHCWQAKSAA
jgi:hypothetical protein